MKKLHRQNMGETIDCKLYISIVSSIPCLLKSTLQDVCNTSLISILQDTLITSDCLGSGYALASNESNGVED